MKDVLDFLNNKIFTKDNISVVVACSGGPDSMALLDIILSLREKKKINVICAHVNHKLRIESEQEKEDVKNYCVKNNIKFEYMEIKKYDNNNFHDQARKIRYNFFDMLMKKYNAKYLFTAHHGDDLIETVLMRITRGSTVKGYSGFEKITKKNNYYLVKPLIYVTKQQLLEYVENNNIKYAVDESNEKSIYTRNRYRKEVLPFLKKEDKNIHKKYIKFSEQLLKYENYIDKQTTSIMQKVISKNKLNIDLFFDLDIVIQEKIIRNMLNKIYKENISLINNFHMNQIFQLIDSLKPNSYINLPGNIIGVKEYNYIYFDYKKNKNSCYKIELIDTVETDVGNIEVVGKSDDTSNYTIRLNSEEVSLPLYIRNIKTSDKMIVKGLNGSKKIKDIYIDMKIPKTIRNKFPILVDQNDNILWLPGLKKSKYDKSKNEKYDIIVKYSKKEEEEYDEEKS